MVYTKIQIKYVEGPPGREAGPFERSEFHSKAKTVQMYGMCSHLYGLPLPRAQRAGFSLKSIFVVPAPMGAGGQKKIVFVVSAPDIGGGSSLFGFSLKSIFVVPAPMGEEVSPMGVGGQKKYCIRGFCPRYRGGRLSSVFL